ncbi:aminotransferase class I/II-fold pyridoxal phosphate-dependent enzyme [Saccharopolyspora aridisoli]|uniref:homocysteine desulfhydrase n=1 Tax=Saccharopolyspora aridisoli TaxID=2530385 RepID=A0A4R4UCS2_9PSEU|nr:aminotransferase class I/II-fold pyridoxal phosphate-dependent enzyme [Saccharopolyspora aridisoli]TDC89080.1 aminotransferase class I/II-fold pyridoxal phosphate-dependent enzyme [Saccharopolyspora aridisoli]
MDEDRIETLAVHGGERRPGPEGSVVYPIYQGTVYSVPTGTEYHDLRYIRLNSTPSQAYLHDKLAALEGAEAGLATASGMAAISTALHSVLRSGDHLLVGDCLYGGTHDFLTHHAADFGWSYTFIDPHRPDTWDAARTPRTKAVLVESITNPLVRVGRLPEVAEFARANGLVSLIDNTFATPVNFRPLSVGFDLVLHSATKYLNGHSDIVAGAIVGGAEHVERTRTTANHFGGSLDPHAGFLLARGLKTLALRVRAQNENALRLAEFLAARPEIEQVNHPGLNSHPDHARASELFDGFGGMLSIRPAGGVAAAQELIDALRLPLDAPSLGGVETLITRPAVTSHAGMSPQDRLALGITDDLVRISVGVEAPEDLIDDFERALAAS